MGQHAATIEWRRHDAVFTDNRYSRRHTMRFDGGTEVRASASPHIVPLPFSDAEAVDPEEAFVAALSSCHLLWFLSIAAKRGFVVDRYVDEAVGVLEENAAGRLAITQVTLRPRVAFSGGTRPTPDEHAQLHEAAHHACFIANSVTSDVRCEPTME